MKNVTIGEELAELRNRLAGCEVVAFADLSTGMVLASDTAGKLTQERLDALCSEGRDALTGSFAQIIRRASGDAAQMPLKIAMCGGGGRVSCFVGAPDPAQEALCFLFGGDATSLEAIPSAAQDVLVRIAAES